MIVGMPWNIPSFCTSVGHSFLVNSHAASRPHGLAITLAVIAVFPGALDEYVGTPEASPVVILTTATLLGIIGTMAGYFPARRASQLDPVVALKLS